jgi:RNA polymerase sigma-70 factor (ECF subfamily)
MTRAGPVAEHFFRRASGRLVAALTRALGPDRLDLAESAVQEAFLRALHVWPLRGVPDRPDAWLYRAARNVALDALRREARFREREEGIAAERRPPDDDGARFPGEIGDDRLRLVFLCCHPALSRPSRVALTLKVAAGFGTAEIARAFRTSESTVAQRIVRAKRTLREKGAPFELPAGGDLRDRLDAVLDVLYLVFNEGYRPGSGDDDSRRELAAEAVRLVRLVSEHPAGRAPHVDALLALLLFQSSRLDARADSDGALLPIEEQDRSRWDRRAVAEAVQALERSARGDRLSDYHLLAGISACHALAPDPARTDWERIVGLYDELIARGGGDLVRLNRAVAVGRARGPAEGLAALRELEDSAALTTCHYLPAARADALDRLGRGADARAEWQRAARLATNGAERLYLERRARGDT